MTAGLHHAGLRWVLDPLDDVWCVRALTALHSLDAGLLVCHPPPGATWPVLVGDLLHVRRRAAQAGFAAEGMHLAVPDTGPAALSVLGPRLTPETVRRLRRLVCPTTAAAVMLGLATDTPAATASRRGPDPYCGPRCSPTTRIPGRSACSPSPATRCSGRRASRTWPAVAPHWPWSTRPQRHDH